MVASLFLMFVLEGNSFQANMLRNELIHEGWLMVCQRALRGEVYRLSLF